MSDQANLDIQDQKKLSTVEEYKFEPIKGYPMLSWRGKRPFTSTQFYPAQLKENHGDAVNGWMNRIYWGDNLQVMSHLLKEFRGKVDLVYIDPPFDSNADYKKQISFGKKRTTNDHMAFEEKQYTDIWSEDGYLQFIYERIILIRELISDTGVLFLHCDWRRGYNVRCILDELFGRENCINSITWKRAHSHGDAGQGAQHFGPVCDTILVYSKSQAFQWIPQYAPYTDEIIARDYKYKDEKGKRYRLMPCDGPGGASKGNPFYEFLGVANYWRYSRETMQALYDKGEIVKSGTGKSLHRIRYLEDAKGTPITDLWDDLNRISPTSSERLDYPTQKPECLLERVIKTVTKPGDLVFDGFMGSGTTQAVAMKLGRKFIGADINLGAIQTTTKRLLGIAEYLQPQEVQGKLNTEPKEAAIPCHYTGFSVYNVNHYDIFRNPAQAKDLLIEALEIQPLLGNTLYDGEKDGRMVKIMPINRIATKADLNELITNFDYREFQKRQEKAPNRPVESLLLVCMGHEPDLAAHLKKECQGFLLDVEVVDILRDKANLEFKRDSEAEITIKDGTLTISAFYPMNLLQKLSLMKENVEEWRELAESIMIDWNYDGAVFEPKLVDVPDKNELVKGCYPVPPDAGTIRVKITDLLSESLEMEVTRRG